jgi:hypothetical protein
MWLTAGEKLLEVVVEMLTRRHRARVRGTRR